MRKSNREVLDFNEKLEIIKRCQVIHIGFLDKEVPYIVPLSFGYEVVGEDIIFYMHGAKEGKKHDLIKECKQVFVELDNFNKYVDLGQSVTADYESIMGKGNIDIVESDEERIHGMELILEHCGVKDKYNAKECILLGITEIFKIKLNSFTAKKRFN